MLDQKDVETKVRVIRREMQARMGVQGRDLAHAIQRAGRRLPKRVRQQGATLAQAAFFARNPKMARRLDAETVQQAYDQVLAHLQGIDPAEDRKDRILGIAETIAFNLLLVAAGFVVLLWWRGYV